MRWRMIGPFRAGRTVGAAGVPGSAERLLHRRQQRRRVEDRRLRPHLEADLRRPADRLDRRARGRAVEPRHSSMSAAAKACSGPISRPATACTNRPTAARRGSTSGLRDGAADRRDHRRSARCRTACLSPCSAIRTGRTKSAAFFARPTAARRGRRCSTRTKTPARSQLAFDPSELADHLRRTCGRRGKARGRTARGKGRTAGFSNRPTAATPGGNSPKGCRHSSKGWDASASAIAPSDPQTSSTRPSMRAQLGGIYRSDDAGESWRRVNSDARAVGPRQRLRRDQSRIRRTPDIVYIANIAAYRSTDGGKTFTRVQRRAGRRRLSHASGSTPSNPQIMLFAADQGAIITVNGGRDLELLVQPADRAVLSRHHRQPVPRTGSTAGSRRAARPASPAAATTARSPSRDWRTVGVEEYGYVAPDPLNSEHHLRRQDHALRQAHGPGAERRARSRAHRQVSLPAHRAGHLLAGRSADALLRGQRAVQDDERRAQSGTSSARTCRASCRKCRRASASIARRTWRRCRAAASSTPSRRRIKNVEHDLGRHR